MIEQIQNSASGVLTYILTGIIGAWVWLFRNVLTNKKQLEMLRAEIDLRDKHREQMREDDRRHLEEFRAEVQAGINGMREDVKDLYSRT